MAKGNLKIMARPVTLLGHLVAIAIATLILVWIFHFSGGVAIKSDNKLKILNVSLSFSLQFYHLLPYIGPNSFSLYVSIEFDEHNYLISFSF
uniref:Uncharacterized protein n=1 Tax=Cucumis sativus TaxID=3659 RepID=A0A0A0KJD9_CUCSA